MTSFDNLVLVIGTIGSTYGQLSPVDRAIHTKHSIDSARSKIPGCYVVYADNSIGTIPDGILKDLGADFTYTIEPNVFTKTANLSQWKSASECYMMHEVLSVIKNQSLIPTKRMFKLGGRYSLTSEFDIKEYDKAIYNGKYALLPMQFASTYDNWANSRRVMRFETGQFSWCPSLLDHLIKVHEGMLHPLLKTDRCIEETMFEFIPHELVVPLTKAHVTGIKAETLEEVSY